MRLVSVYDDEETAAQVLYALLGERDPIANISHKELPSYPDHLVFIARRPYVAWYLIEGDDEDGAWVGAIYITAAGEIGLQLFEASRNRGYGSQAVKQLMALHPRPRYLANVAPANLPSQHFWLKFGFKPLQVTYELCP